MLAVWTPLFRRTVNSPSRRVGWLHFYKNYEDRSMDRAPAGKVWEPIEPRERLKAVFIALGMVGIGCPLIWWSQSSFGNIEQDWWLVWPLPAICFPVALLYYLRKRRLVPTPEASAKKAADEAEAQRKNEEMEKKWWSRYSVAILMCGGAWYLADHKPGLWWMSLLFVLAAAIYAREVSIVILGLGLIAAVLTGLAAMPLPLAIILAGSLIAYAVYRKKDPSVDERLPLIGWCFRQRRKAREAQQVAEVLSNPYFSTLQFALDHYWTNSEFIHKNFSDDGRANYRQQLVDEAIKIAEAEDPVQALREHLAEAVMEAAKYQVLVIPAAPDDDETGMRGVLGISGELKAHLLELAKQSKPLREWLHGFGLVETWDDVWNPVLFRHWYTLTRANVLSSLRKPLDDAHNIPKMDWYRPFLESQCAFQEHEYREALGWPSNLADERGQAGIEALKLSLYVNCVVQGAKYPDLDFQDRMKKIEQKLD